MTKLIFLSQNGWITLFPSITVAMVTTQVLPMGVPDSPLGSMCCSLSAAPQLVVHPIPFIPHLRHSILLPLPKKYPPWAPKLPFLQFLLICPKRLYLLSSSQLPKVSLEVLKEDVLAGLLPIPALYQVLNYPVDMVTPAADIA